MDFSNTYKFSSFLLMAICIGCNTLPAMQQAPITIFPFQQITPLNDIVVECAKPCKQLLCAGCKGAATISCCTVCGACCMAPSINKTNQGLAVTDCDMCCYSCGSCLLLPIELYTATDTPRMLICKIPLAGFAIGCCFNASSQFIQFCCNPEK